NTEKPDLIIMDVWIGGIDGNELAKKIKLEESTKKIPIILISALADLSKIASECRADDYIEKPFEIDNLINIVKKNIRK
ncbi:response regulator, partial [Candidatus Parcubacteria bacterium]